MLMVLCILCDRRIRYERYYTIYFTCVMILLAGFKYRVGTDALLYEDLFNIYPDFDKITASYIIESRWAPLFIYIFSFFHTFFHDFIFFQFFHAAVLLFSLNLILNYYLKKPIWGVTLFFVSYYLYLTFDLYREGLAVAFFFIGYYFYASKRNYILFFFFCFLAYNTHISSFFCFFLPLIENVKLNRRNFYYPIIIALLLSFIITSYPKLLNLVLPSSQISDLATHYLSRTQGRGISISRIIYVCLLTYFLIYRNLDNNIVKEKKLIPLTYLYIIIATLDNSIPFIFRLNNYFFIFALIATCNLIERDYYKKSNRNIIKTLFVILLFSSQRLSDEILNEVTYNAYNPYVTVFNPYKVSEREFHTKNAYLFYDQRNY